MHACATPDHSLSLGSHSLLPTVHQCLCMRTCMCMCTCILLLFTRISIRVPCPHINTHTCSTPSCSPCPNRGIKALLGRHMHTQTATETHAQADIRQLTRVGRRGGRAAVLGASLSKLRALRSRLAPPCTTSNHHT
jgi:hypothetical protein